MDSELGVELEELDGLEWCSSPAVSCFPSGDTCHTYHLCAVTIHSASVISVWFVQCISCLRGR